MGSTNWSIRCWFEIPAIPSFLAAYSRAAGCRLRSNPVIEAGVDASIRPGDDFFAYVNGGWVKETQIPEGSPRWNARNEINEVTRRQLEKLIDDAASAPAESDAHKVAAFRAAYLNEAAIEA